MSMEALQREPRWAFPLSYWRKSSPSRVEGMSFDDELLAQSKGVQFVTRMAASLRLPQQTIFAATLFLHRFYTRNSVKRLHPYQIGAACVFLACKTEETPRKLKSVAAAAAKMALKLPKSLGEVEQQHPVEVDQWYKVILGREDELLQSLKFDFAETSPYDALESLIHKYVPPPLHDDLRTRATMFVNDSCRTLLSVELTMRELAVTALYWAVKAEKTSLPHVNGARWYEDEMTRPTIVKYVNDMAEMIATVRHGVLDGQKYEKMQ